MRRRALALAGLLALTVIRGIAAQQAPAAASGNNAPLDITGYWVTAITEDWRVRMITPQIGDHSNLPLNEAGEKLVKEWTPEADRRNPDAACRPYGAAAIMRMPTRIHITWQDPETLKFEFDHGTQTRLVHFRPTPAGERSWQGHALGEWIDLAGERFGSRGTRGAAGQGQAALKVVTTNLKAQYVRKNGAPVSERTTVTDTIERITGPTGDDWLIVKTLVQDPVYFTFDLMTSSHFKREPNGSKFSPTPCEVEAPPTPRPVQEPPAR